jgi:hypothetical protein
MNVFHEHPEDLVYVRSDKGTYADTWQNFEADFGRPLEELPEGVFERIYEQGVRHALNGKEGTIGGGDRAWAYGDAAIAAVESLLVAQAARRQPVPPDAVEKIASGSGGLLA